MKLHESFIPPLSEKRKNKNTEQREIFYINSVKFSSPLFKHFCVYSVSRSYDSHIGL